MRRTVRAGITVAAMVASWMAVHRTSPAVRGWTPSARLPLDVAPLAMTRAGTADDDVVAVLLHGIISSGHSFGAEYDTVAGTVVVPDLLGFGQSMDVPTDGYTITDHVSAIVDTLRSAGLHQRPTVLVGHSMGAVLALHVAAEIPELRGVVAISAPLYDTEEEALARVGEADPLARFLATGDLAERICRWMCAHRTLARRTWPIMAPTWPRQIAQDGVLHTWPAYRGSLGSLVLHSDYRAALDALAERDIPLVLLNGDQDGVPVAGRAAGLAARLDNVRSEQVPGAGHELPMSQPRRCTAIIRTLA